MNIGELAKQSGLAASRIRFYEAQGLINRVVPVDALAEHTLALARQLEASAPQALGRLKRLMRQSDQNDLHTQLQAEARDFVACAGTADFAEGVSAFLAKRPARFSGR